MAEEALRTVAWRLIGLTRSEPGVLELKSQHLTFETDEQQYFRTPLSEVRDVRFPWYYFGGGVKFRVGEAKYRLSFVRPNNAEDLSLRLLSRTAVGGAAAAATVVIKARDIKEGRQLGRRWRAVFESR